MLEYTERKPLIKISVLVFVIIFTTYMFFFRGWVEKVEITEQELNTAFKKIDQLDYSQHFSDFNYSEKVEINGEKYTVIYDKTDKSYDIMVYSLGKQSLTFSICNKDDFQLNFDLDGIVTSESEVKQKIKAKYGSIDLLYNLFSKEISTEYGKAYLSPVSRVRSEIYSFTGEKNISGVLSTDSYTVAFSCTSETGDIDLFFSFLDYLLQNGTGQETVYLE